MNVPPMPEKIESTVDQTSEMPEEYLITSHSIDGTFESCPRRFEFLHSYMRAPERESDAWAADVGTAIHEAAQAWQRALYAGATHAAAEAAGQIQLLKFWPWDIEEARRQMNPETGRSLGVGQRDMGGALMLLQAIYESDIWNNWELVEVENFGPAIEVPWRIIHRSLGRIPVAYGKQVYMATQGKIDFILRHKTNGKYRIVDIKTTEKKLPAHNASFRFSGQAGQYGVVLDHALGLDWEHNGLDVIYLIAYFAENDVMVYPLEYHLDPEEVADAVDAKMERLLRMKAYAFADHWTRRTHGCEFYGTPCGFLDICHRRDRPYVEEWFEFEIARGTFKKYERIYDPVWVLEA